MPITLNRQEEIEILEDIARNGSAVARIQALRRLEELRVEERATPEGFEGLYAVNGKGRFRDPAKAT